MDVQTFFENRCVFITGGTGFMGKVLVEKLLRSCPGLDKVYLLIRGTDKSSASQRLQNLARSQLFQRANAEIPGLSSKMVVVEGDVTMPGLGLSQEDTLTIVQNVSVVFHVAATVRFNETLRVASQINLEGTKNVAELAKQITKLKAFVHVSTAYSNCNRKYIDEIIYPSKIVPTEFLDILKNLSNEELERLTPGLIGDHPNTYTFTKQMAENYLVQNCKNLPVIITRPAIVTAAWREPYPGWIDNKYGLTGILLLIGQGLLQTLQATMELPSEIFPVDIGVNHMIAAAWDVANRESRDGTEVPVLNSVSSPVNPLTRQHLSRTCEEVVKIYPVGTAYRYPRCTVTTNRIIFNFLFFILHYLPASMVDLYFIAKGDKPFAVTSCTKLYNVLDEYSTFLVKENVFTANNVLDLQTRLSTKDKITFNLSIKTLNWRKYFENYGIGVRRWLLNEPEDNLPEARKQLRSLYYKTKLLHAGLVAAVGTLLWQKGFFQIFTNLVF